MLKNISTFTNWIKNIKKTNKDYYKWEMKMISFISLPIIAIVSALFLFTNVTKFDFVVGPLLGIEGVVFIYALVISLQYHFIEKNKIPKIWDYNAIQENSIEEILNFVIAVNLVKENKSKHAFDIIYKFEEALISNKSIIQNNKNLENLPEKIKAEYISNNYFVAQIMNTCIEQFVKLNLAENKEFELLFEKTSFEEKMKKIKLTFKEETSTLEKYLTQEEREQFHQRKEEKLNKYLAL